MRYLILTLLLSFSFSECDDLSALQCSSNADCEWIEDVEIGNCSVFDNSEISCTSYSGECYWDEDITYTSCDYPNSGICNSYEGCYWDCFYGYCNCNGQQQIVDTECIGQYEIDNSYCEEAPYELGDINQDDIINVMDIISVVNLILNDSYEEIADLNQDQFLNVIDLLLIIDIILNN